MNFFLFLCFSSTFFALLTTFSFQSNHYQLSLLNSSLIVGIGDLVAAALLAKSGKRVLVLEQHDQAGGCCHSFTEKGFEFDTGIHYIGEMRNNTAFRFLIDQISNGQLKWANVCDDFDTVVLVEGNNSYTESLEQIENAISSNTTLSSRWVGLIAPINFFFSFFVFPFFFFFYYLLLDSL